MVSSWHWLTKGKTILKDVWTEFLVEHIDRQCFCSSWPWCVCCTKWRVYTCSVLGRGFRKNRASVFLTCILCLKGEVSFESTAAASKHAKLPNWTEFPADSHRYAIYWVIFSSSYPLLPGPLFGGEVKGFSEKKVCVGVEEAQPEADAKRWLDSIRTD